MQSDINKYDCAIVGGGLAGLCLAIQMIRLNHSVVIFEKNEYPFHKVCGEYISNESWDFLENLGLPLSKMNLPKINQLGVSSTKGFMLKSPLKMGGFGISRFTLDYELSLIARKHGVVVMQNCKVNNVIKKEIDYLIETADKLGLKRHDGCFYIEEPHSGQAGIQSRKMSGYICKDPVFNALTGSPSQYQVETVIFDLRK